MNKTVARIKVKYAQFAVGYFFRVFKWAWNGWKYDIDIMPPDENGAMVGMQITIGDFIKEVSND